MFRRVVFVFRGCVFADVYHQVVYHQRVPGSCLSGGHNHKCLGNAEESPGAETPNIKSVTYLSANADNLI